MLSLVTRRRNSPPATAWGMPPSAPLFRSSHASRPIPCTFGNARCDSASAATLSLPAASSHSKLAAWIPRPAADEITKLKAAGGEPATEPTPFFRTLFQSSTLAHSQSLFPPLDTLTPG